MSAAERESEGNEKGRELGGQNRSNPPIQQHVGQQLFHNIDNNCSQIEGSVRGSIRCVRTVRKGQPGQPEVGGRACGATSGGGAAVA